MGAFIYIRLIRVSRSLSLTSVDLVTGASPAFTVVEKIGFSRHDFGSRPWLGDPELCYAVACGVHVPALRAFRGLAYCQGERTCLLPSEALPIAHLHPTRLGSEDKAS